MSVTWQHPVGIGLKSHIGLTSFLRDKNASQVSITTHCESIWIPWKFVWSKTNHTNHTGVQIENNILFPFPPQRIQSIYEGVIQNLCRQNFTQFWPPRVDNYGHFTWCLKQSQNKKGRKFVSAAPKMVSFFTAGSWQKDITFGAAEINFRSFLFWQG